MIEEGNLKFGFNENITEFVLESFEEKGDIIICKCVYIDNNKYLNKYVEFYNTEVNFQGQNHTYTLSINEIPAFLRDKKIEDILK